MRIAVDRVALGHIFRVFRLTPVHIFPLTLHIRLHLNQKEIPVKICSFGYGTEIEDIFTLLNTKSRLYYLSGFSGLILANSDVFHVENLAREENFLREILFP
jgi:hypothetical protein